jgi:tetraacyldisaccharide 4'-kinase
MGWEIILMPFALIYKWITDFRNHLYNIGNKPSFRFEVATLGVGNLTVGGTGKTPFVEFLIRNLKSGYKITTLSRGYGRKTKGFRICTDYDTAVTIGDEPFQIFNKYGDSVKVAVGEERVLAVPQILHEFPETDLILLDDIFQHRKVDPHFNILLSDFNRPFYEDYLLPAGRLRESRKGARRADVVLVTKCPAELNDNQQRQIERRIKKYADSRAEIFFTTVEYAGPEPVFGRNFVKSDHVIILSGIANPEPFEKFVSADYSRSVNLRFHDHHNYGMKDVKRILSEYQKLGKSGTVSIITTEKDMVRLKNDEFEKYLGEIPFYFVPITVRFLKEEGKFLRILEEKIKEKSIEN